MLYGSRPSSTPSDLGRLRGQPTLHLLVHLDDAVRQPLGRTRL